MDLEDIARSFESRSRKIEGCDCSCSCPAPGGAFGARVVPHGGPAGEDSGGDMTGDGGGGGTTASSQPFGIYSGGISAWTNPKAKGRFKKYYWRDLEPTAGNYNFTDIDKQLAFGTDSKKGFIPLLNLNGGDPSRGINGLPAWLTALGATAYAFDNQHHDALQYLYLPWDPVFQERALLLIAAFCDHCDGKLASVSMGGLGATTETHMPEPSPDGKTNAEAIDLWLESSAIIVAQYNAHLSTTPFTAAISPPYSGDDGDAALETFVSDALTLYGPRLGFENWGLNAGSIIGYPPNGIISSHSATNHVGFQMAGNATSGGGGNLRGTLRAAMDAGVELLAQYLQVFSDDVDNPVYADDFDAINAALAQPPPQD